MEETLLQIFYSGVRDGTSLMPFIIAFIAGSLSFLSPCVLPLVPAYMSYISGLSLEQLDSSGRAIRFSVFWRACLFVLGFSVVFISVGLALSSIITLMQSPIINVLAGAIVLLFGVHFLGLWRIGLLYKTLHFDFVVRARALQILAPFLLGVSFAFGYTPCTGAIFGAITLFVGASHYDGYILLLLYVCGLALPFLLVAVILEKAFSVLARLKRFMRAIEILSGVILIILGVFIMSGSMDMLSEWIMSRFRF